MAERSLNLPLSGEEIVIAVTEKLAEAMRRDCFLSQNTAYESFRAEVTVKILMTDLGRTPEAEFHVTQEVGHPTLSGNLSTAETAFTMEPAPPNEVRMETGQPLPVLTTGQATGRPEIKPVRYQKPGTFQKKDLPR